MNWHARFAQQAKWTRELRAYLFERAGLNRARRVLEVGCGTGAVLGEISSPASLHGVDLNLAALAECRVHAPAAWLTRGDALWLPYPAQSFEIVFCHFLLLWVDNPLRAVREMARVGKTVLAMAEPDYSARVDRPVDLSLLGEWQAESLRRQGANPSFGAQLAETFDRAGIKLLETGPIQGRDVTRSDEEWEQEWAVLESDLTGIASGEEIRKLKALDKQAHRRGDRVLYVPTYFAWGQP